MATIAQQLSELVTQKNQLAANLTSKGVDASSSETFNSLVPKVLTIPSGIDTSDATATAACIREGYTAYINGEKVTGTIPDYGATTYIPTTEDQHFEPGSYISGVQTIKGDANLISENIKKGVTIFNVEGILDASGIDTSDATATASDILNGKTAYVDGAKLTGNIPSLAETEYTPSVVDQTISAGQYLSGVQIIKGDTNLIASNIRKGVTLFNVLGTYEGGGGGISTIDILDCTSMTSSTEVYNAYTDIVMVSNDGAYATFSNLSDYVDYQTIAAIYQQELAGINIRAGVSNTGFYFTVPVAIQSSHALFKLIYYVSTWINPSIQFNLILADSIDEIPAKIAAGDTAWSKSIVLANTNNKQSSFFEFTDLPIGTYYLFVSMPTETGGNEAVVNCIQLLEI